MSAKATFHIPGRHMAAESFHYTASGLGNIYLQSGFTFEDDPEYGRIVTIESEDDLLRAIGLHIFEESHELTGAEFRFLRKLMGLTQKELGSTLAISAQTVANYEKGATAIAGPARKFLRLLFAVHFLPDDARASVVKSIAAPASLGRRALPARLRQRIARRWREPAPVAA